jgi:hypothetical protein
MTPISDSCVAGELRRRWVGGIGPKSLVRVADYTSNGKRRSLQGVVTAFLAEIVGGRPTQKESGSVLWTKLTDRIFQHLQASRLGEGSEPLHN